MNVFDKINYMIESVNRHNEKIYQENPPLTPPKKQFPYTKKENIAAFEKNNAAYERENEKRSNKIDNLITKFPHVLLVTEQACLAEYLSVFVSEKMNIHAFATSTHFISVNQINKDTELADMIGRIATKGILQIDRIEDLKESLLVSFFQKSSVIASASNYNNLENSLREMFFLVISGADILKLSEYYVCHLLEAQQLDFTPDVISSIINATEKRTLSLKTMTKNVIDFLQMKDSSQKTVRLDDVSNYLAFCGVPEKTTSQISRSRRISDEVRLEVWKRDEGMCVMCSSQEWIEYDHIIPFSKGGSNTARNIQLLCESCNRTKSAEI
jgi:hypothetical protein